MSVQIVSGGIVRRVEQAAGPTPSYGGAGVTTVPWLRDVLHNQSAIRRHRARMLDPEFVYETQPAVRKVVDFLVAKFQRPPLKGYNRRSRTDRVELESGDLADAIREPWPRMPFSRLAGELLRDRLLWDRWALLPMFDAAGKLRLRRMPPRLWTPQVDGFGDIVNVQFGSGVDVDPANLVVWAGREGGRSPMRAIQDVLADLIEAARYREQTFRRTGRVPAVIERPREAPKWSPEAADNFTSSFSEKYAGDGSHAGEIPVLEEGMTLKSATAFSPLDLQYLEGVTLGEIQTCGFFHLAPELIGARAANYSNMDAFRQGLYAETLGGYYVSFQDELNVQLVPTVGGDGDYVEFLLEAVLAGSFLEQAEALSRATGAPWLGRDEARAKQNLPPRPGLDEMVVPLNVIVGGLSSPADTAPGRKAILDALAHALDPDGVHVAGTKAAPPRLAGVVRDRLAGELERFYAEQRDAVLEQLGAAKGGPALDWDEERWNTRLERIILSASPLGAAEGAKAVLERLDPEYDWTDAPMDAWLRAAAAGTAKRTNENTRSAVVGELASNDWPDAVAGVFAARIARSGGLAQSITTESLSFGGHEAAKAVGARFKRWKVTSSNPRTTHALIDGETVPIDGVFTNGGRYPGDHTLSPDERAGCTCVLEYVGGEGL
jgi:hypothetical protein